MQSQQQDVITRISAQLYETPILRAVNVVVNDFVDILICLSCGTAISPTFLVTHLRKHSTTIRQDQKTLLENHLFDLDLPVGLPFTPTSVVVAIEGLPIHEAFYCPDCVAAFGVEDSLKKHRRELHPRIHPQKPATKGPAQKFNNSFARTFFRVLPPRSSDNADPNKPIYNILQEIEAGQKSLVPEADIRNVTPWLRVTKWNESFKGIDTDSLRAMVVHPTAYEFPDLANSVLFFFTKASDFIDKTTTLVLEKLNSPDPHKNGINNKPFSRHQDHSKTLPGYCVPVVNLLAMFLRPEPILVIELPDDIGEAVTSLSSSIRGQAVVETISDDIFRLLLLIWTRSWTTVQGSKITDPTIQYVALSTLQEDGGFSPPGNVSGTLARFQYCMRLTFLTEMHQSPDIEQACDRLQHWFIEKNESTFNSIRTLQHVATSIVYTTVSVAKVFWTSSDYDLLIYRGTPIPFRQLPVMFQAHEDEMVQIFQEQILLGLDLSVTYSHIFDDPSNNTPGYSFIHDTRNPFQKCRTMLLDAILASPQLSAKFVKFNDGRTVLWNHAMLRQWLVAYSKLQCLQLTRANMTTGSPSRGTELTAMLLTNTAEYPLRNCIVFGRYVTLLCTYAKTSNLSGNDKCIPHALDAFSSDLLIQDLSIARPFAELAAHIYFNGSPTVVRLYRNHLFVNQDKLFQTEDLTIALEMLTLTHLGVKLGVRHWRHVNTAFRRKICPHMDQLLDDDEKDSIPALQMGHRRATENRVYGISQEGLVGASEDLLPLFLDASTDWQVACSVVPGGLAIPYTQARVSNFANLVDEGKIKPRSTSANDKLMAYVNKSLSEYILALDERLLKQEQHLNQKLEEQKDFLTSVFRHELCEQEKRLMKQLIDTLNVRPTEIQDSDLPVTQRITTPLPSSSSLTCVSDSPSVPSNSITPETSLEFSPFSSPDLPPPTQSLESMALDALRTLLGTSDAEWTSPQQRQGVLAVLECQRDILAIMATGSGKTMLALIPVLVQPDKTTVVILPFIALQHDYCRRLNEFSIPYEVFDNHRLQGQANLIIVSADKAVATEWKQAISVLNHSKSNVARYVFDEGHVPLEAQNYRPVLRRVEALREVFPLQFVILSGSITEAQESVVRHMFCLGPDTLTIRTKTNRPELKFVWLPEVQTSALTASVEAVLTAHDDTSDEKSRALIFVSSKALGNKISQATGFDFYCGGDLAPPQRIQYHNRWISGEKRVMVCTSAFGAGNDYAHTRLVIHAGSPFEMIGYIQEVSRAGRDKKSATCVLIPTPRGAPDISTGDQDFGGKIAMHTALTKRDECIRFVLTAHIDGSGTRCFDQPDNEICSFCAPDTVDPLKSQEPTEHDRPQMPHPRLHGPVTLNLRSQGDQETLLTNKRTHPSPFQAQTDESKRRRVSQEYTELEYTSNFLSYLAAYDSRCPYCIVNGEVNTQHPFSTCKNFNKNSRGGFGAFYDFSRSLRYKDNQRVCYRCHLPNGYEDRIHPTFKPNQDCKYQDLLRPLAFALYRNPLTCKQLEDQFGITLRSEYDFISWLNAPPIPGHKNNLSAVFLWYAAQTA